jgi:nicotinamide-nucleotide amidase
MARKSPDLLSAQLGDLLRNKKLFVVTAESCTGGGVAEVITRTPGSSGWFDRGFVTYSNNAKHELLGIDTNLLEQYGAVSKEVAEAMVTGALRNSHAQAGLAVTGIAGPEGGSKEKPVGTVWIAWQFKNNDPVCKHFLFQGDRRQIRLQACHESLQGLIKLLT